MTTSTILEAVELAAGYHGHPIIHDLDLRVDAGEVVSLVGPNGAGKTTALMTLAGALPVLGGEVRFLGQRTTAPLHRRARAGLAFVTEKRGTFMRLSTADNLRVARCDERLALELFPELEPLLDRQAGQLSGGEQQMLTLARALARRPKLLLADELSLGLAPRVVQRLLQAVRDAAREQGIGALIVEQHVDQALRVSDRVYALRRGAIVVSGAPEAVAGEIDKAYLSASAPDRAG